MITIATDYNVSVTECPVGGQPPSNRSRESGTNGLVITFRTMWKKTSTPRSSEILYVYDVTVKVTAD